MPREIERAVQQANPSPQVGGRVAVDQREVLGAEPTSGNRVVRGETLELLLLVAREVFPLQLGQEHGQRGQVSEDLAQEREAPDAAVADPEAPGPGDGPELGRAREAGARGKAATELRASPQRLQQCLHIGIAGADEERDGAPRQVVGPGQGRGARSKNNGPVRPPRKMNSRMSDSDVWD